MDLYFTTHQEHLVSGLRRESSMGNPLMDHLDQPSGGWGVHFTPDGYVATVTSSGRVYLIDRPDGQVVSTLDLQTSLGFVPPQPFGLDLDPSALLPEAVQHDIEAIWGNASNSEQRDGFGALLGSGEFVDNTISISSRGEMYVISGGPSDEEGALIQIKVDSSTSTTHDRWVALNYTQRQCNDTIGKPRWSLGGDWGWSSSLGLLF